MAAKILFLDGQWSTPIVSLAVFWAISIGTGGILMAVGHLLVDKLGIGDLIKKIAFSWDDKLNEWRGQEKGETRLCEVLNKMVGNDDEATYKLRYSRLYVWAQFNLSMSMALFVIAFPMPQIVSQYSDDRYIGNTVVVWIATFIAILAMLYKWATNMRLWEYSEGVTNAKKKANSQEAS